MASVKKSLRRMAIITPLKGVERLIQWRSRAPAAPPLFILGLPRSGTTLVYQYLVHRLQVAYFTNGVGRFPKSPCAVTWWERRRYGEYHSDFKSHYGQALGHLAPHEAGEVWARWFGYDDYVKFEELTARETETLRRTVACVERIYEHAPFVNKNVKHLLRIDALQKIFPNAAFLLVQRDLADVALSVLRARYANGGDARRWWSVKPSNYEEIKNEPPHRQVALQLSTLELRMKQDLQAVPAHRLLQMDYGDFCKNPETLIESLRGVWSELPFRNPPVERFETTVNQPRTSEEQELAALLAGPGLCSK